MEKQLFDLKWLSFTCSASDYGRTFHTSTADNPRLFPRVPRDSKEWRNRYKLRTGVERCIKRQKILSWYADMERGRDYFRFVTVELPSLCESMFPLSSSRDERFISGAGAGGYGALKAGMLASETFGRAASFSADLDVLRVYDELGADDSESIFGPKERLAGSEHDLFAAAQRLAASGGKRSELLMWCSASDRTRYDEHTRFEEHAAKLELPVAFEFGEGSGGWDEWDSCIERFIAGLPLRTSDL